MKIKSVKSPTGELKKMFENVVEQQMKMCKYGQDESGVCSWRNEQGHMFKCMCIMCPNFERLEDEKGDNRN